MFSTTALTYGDVIALEGESKPACHLEADGHRDSRLWARESIYSSGTPPNNQGALFELLPMLQYAARREEWLVLGPLVD